MSIELSVLDLEGLALIDNGIINQMFRFHALKLGRDCADRPGETGARTMTITITAIPVSSQKGDAGSRQDRDRGEQQTADASDQGLPDAGRRRERAAVQSCVR